MYTGVISKMRNEYKDPINYYLMIDGQEIFLNELLNQHISLKWLSTVECMCKKRFPKFYRQNFCYQCYWNAPQASLSIFKPELCTADLNIEERDLDWEKKFQISPHYIYLANSSKIKVGITRKGQQITRWMDQGAVQAIILAEVPNRRLSGLIEVELKQYVADKTNWRKMLSGIPDPVDLVSQKNIFVQHLPDELKKYAVSDDTVVKLAYPIEAYPSKIKSLKLEKVNHVQGILKGIKGQYLIFEDSTVFNVRSHQGFVVDFSC